MCGFQTLLTQASVLTTKQAEHECGMPVNQLQKAVAIQPEHVNWRDCTRCLAVMSVIRHKVFIEEDLPIAVAEAVTTSGRELYQSSQNRVKSSRRFTPLKQDAPCRQKQLINIAMLSNQLNSGRH